MSLETPGIAAAVLVVSPDVPRDTRDSSGGVGGVLVVSPETPGTAAVVLVVPLVSPYTPGTAAAVVIVSPDVPGDTRDSSSGGDGAPWCH